MAIRVILSAAALLVPAVVRARWKAELLDMVKAGSEDRQSPLEIRQFGNLRVAYRAGTVDEQVLNHSFDNDIFFPGVPEYQPLETDVILDIGAHIGTFSLLAASRVPRGSVYAIEACQDSHHFLEVNKALNGLTNLSVYRLALAGERGTATLYYDAGSWGHSIVSPLSARSESVETCSLPQFLDDNLIGRIDFLKSNCEGAEFPIFLNTPAEVLHKFHTMLILYHCDLWPHNSLDELLAHLQAAGFHTDIRNAGDVRGWIVAVNQNWQA